MSSKVARHHVLNDVHSSILRLHVLYGIFIGFVRASAAARGHNNAQDAEADDTAKYGRGDP